MQIRTNSHIFEQTRSDSHKLATEFPLSLGDLGDLGDQKYFYQWNSEKRN
jgi:hypothetical protein